MWSRIKSGDPVIIAGVMGSMVALVYTRPLDWTKALLCSVGGTGAAIFISPAITEGLSDSAVAAVSFLLGVFSMSAIGIVFQVVERIHRAPIKTIGEIANIVIDVLLAFRQGVSSNRRKSDSLDDPLKDDEESLRSRDDS